VLQSACAVQTLPARLGPKSSASSFSVVVGGWSMLTVIVIVVIVALLLYLVRDRLPQLRR
jgi:hypothetical protein